MFVTIELFSAAFIIRDLYESDWSSKHIFKAQKKTSLKLFLIVRAIVFGLENVDSSMNVLVVL